MTPNEVEEEDAVLEPEDSTPPYGALMSMLNGTPPAPVAFARPVSADRHIPPSESKHEEPIDREEDAPYEERLGHVDVSVLGLQAYLAVPESLPSNCDIYQVDALEGALLNRAVRLAIYRLKKSHYLLRVRRQRFNPVEHHGHSGVLIHEYRISISFPLRHGDAVQASRVNEAGEFVQGYGDTYQIAAMRCFVRSVFGRELVIRELPRREFPAILKEEEE